MLVLSLVFMAVEVAAALVTGSLALLSDAGHMLGDSIGLAMAVAAISVAQRGRVGSRRTFGFHRTEVLVAGLNGLILLGLCGWVIYQAVRRLGDPVEIDSVPVLLAGALGLVVNLAGLAILRSGSKESLNVRGAYLEVLGDALGSVAVIVSAVVVFATGWDPADTVASLVIAAMILPRAASLLRDVGNVLLEGTPAEVDLEELRTHIVGVDGVAELHDLHVWTITSGMPVMSAHVVLDDDVTRMAEAHGVLDRLRDCLSDHFDVEHSTFQLEPRDHVEHGSHVHH